MEPRAVPRSAVGLILDILSYPSPNHGDRRGQEISLIVLHYTAMTSAEAALKALSDPKREVSAHYLIGADGSLWQLVEDDRRAWHAGAGSWQGVDDVNSRSIGIELDNDGFSPFSAALMNRLEELLVTLLKRYDLPPSAVIAHSDLAPGRKIDPGQRFDWCRMARQGLAVWPDAAAPGDFAAHARAVGYPEEAGEEELLASFRMRFRPGHSGPLDDTDRALAAGLVSKLA